MQAPERQQHDDRDDARSEATSRGARDRPRARSRVRSDAASAETVDGWRSMDSVKGT